MKFIDSVIRNLEPSDKRQVFWCDDSAGFGLRLTPNGTKTFVYKYMLGRKSRWLTLGKYPQYSIRKARRQYDEYYEQVNDYRRDPVEEIQQKKEANKGIPTFADFLPTYEEVMRLKGKATIDHEIKILNCHAVPVIGNKPLNSVTSSDIDDIQTNILKSAAKQKNASRGGRSAVKHTLVYISQAFELAKKKHKNVVTNNPVNDIESLGEAGVRERVLSFQEIWHFWHNVEDCSSPVTAKALKFLLVSMQRSNEVRFMRHDAIQDNIWHMHMSDTKNNTIHRVPLTPLAHQLIKQAMVFTEACPYVFGATRASKAPKQPKPDLIPLGQTAFSQVTRKNKDKLNITDFKPHDLRRSAATWITAVGLPKLYARLMLNHNDGDNDVTGEVYVQYSYDFEKRKAADVWQFILEQVIHCKYVDDVPSLDEMRKQVKQSGLL
ncbi:tyrosine-type recombinase/integrase [Agarilytica rhodophyticola]|uniref:tyrosine-type recombinase/integrase n=1 Tax=Agarilytica rhodophyticola TaxID=1737490 RepID=UPI000B34574E|nr:integrase family protein [Agarilytica rhodophyticola]